ncbi:hypothetical protein OTU49_001573 [Cherax quadricarinatus]|uniref:Coiled-coil domain-containing protein 12 n=1 Tax=Cherax quadricarinatus TaxID=27406 RepID=A0AAW0XU06_CHEQU|nr:coiled-coil domain-containing protein 12-like [Cherax quadricarinatus]
MGQRDEEKVGTLEEAALKRREKLFALKRQRREGQEKHQQEVNGEEEEELPPSQVLFRNYKPQTASLEEVVLPVVKPEDVEALVQQQIDDGERAKEEVQVEITNLAPKKITFDLKRGIQTHLDKLERRTDKAIAELIRQRLKEGKQQDFLIAVNAGARAQQKAGYDSDED